MYRHLLHQIDCLRPAPGAAWLRVVAWGLGLMAALLGMPKAQADGTWDDCMRSTGNNPLYYHWYPPTTIHLGNDAVVGDVIGPWITTSQSAWKCTRRAIYGGMPVQVSVQGYPPYEHWNRFVNHDGETYAWYRLGDTSWALGYITRWRAIVDGDATEWTPLTIYPGYQNPKSMVSVIKDAGDEYYIHVETQLRFVKQDMNNTNLVSGYQQNIADPIYVRHYQKVGTTESLGGGTYLIGQMLQGTVNFVGGGTCTTPNVSVKLPDVGTSEFSGPNSILYTTPFELKFQNCPPGLYGIGYHFTPTTSIVDAAQGVIALDGSATATGVGLKLTENSGAALKFGQANTYQLPYDPAIVNSYTVPLKVAYYQTDNVVTSGAVSSSMTVTLKYQ